jgi:hypothetical protein
MQLARTILQENSDPTFFDDLIKRSTDSKKDAVTEILQHGSNHGFTARSLDWILDEMAIEVKNVLQMSRHPVMIKALQQYGMQKWIDQWNIAMHPFFDPEMVYEFFAPSKTLGIPEDAIDALVSRTFSETTMLLGSSFIFSNRDNLYFVFSKIERHEPDDAWLITVKFLEQKVMSSDREWLDAVSWYLEEKFPEHDLFQLLKLNPDDIL